MTNDEVLQCIDNNTVGPDDTFTFHCTKCGKCCRNREDILLSALDIYKMSKALKMTPVDFYKKYCRSHIGDNSRLPVVRLNSVGKDNHCPLLRNNKCAVHQVKPTVCAMYPLGRYIAILNEDGKELDASEWKVKYLVQSVACGEDSETHTVQEWLAGFDIQTEDDFFIKWHAALMDVGKLIHKAEKKEHMAIMFLIWDAVRFMLYLNYDTEQEFMPQLEANTQQCILLLNDVPKLKEKLAYVG